MGFDIPVGPQARPAASRTVSKRFSARFATGGGAPVMEARPASIPNAFRCGRYCRPRTRPGSAEGVGAGTVLRSNPGVGPDPHVQIARRGPVEAIPTHRGTEAPGRRHPTEALTACSGYADSVAMRRGIVVAMTAMLGRPASPVRGTSIRRPSSRPGRSRRSDRCGSRSVTSHVGSGLTSRSPDSPPGSSPRSFCRQGVLKAIKPASFSVGSSALGAAASPGSVIVSGSPGSPGSVTSSSISQLVVELVDHLGLVVAVFLHVELNLVRHGDDLGERHHRDDKRDCDGHALVSADGSGDGRSARNRSRSAT